MKKLFTSESVTEGHPDKICDQISDAILDEIFRQDPNGRVAAETTVNTGYAMVMGEITTECYIDIQKIARDVICDIGYTKSDYGFNSNNNHVNKRVFRLSEDVFGLYYITDFGQLIVSAYSLSGIHSLERDLRKSVLAPYLMATAKYEFKEPVLYEFIQSDFEDFNEFLEFIRSE